MKTLIFVLIYAFLYYSKQQTTDQAHPHHFHEYKIACAQEHGVEASETAKIWTEPEYPANNQDMKCYYACVWVKAGFIKNGKLDNVDFRKMFGHFKNTTQLKKIGDKCTDLPANKDQCELAYQLLSCAAKSALG